MTRTIQVYYDEDISAAPLQDAAVAVIGFGNQGRAQALNLRDAGFAEVRVYWEGTGPDGEGNGVFRLSKKGDDSEAYVAYVVAVK